MTALSSAGTTITTKAPSRLMGQPRKANVITHRDPKPIPDDNYYLTTSCVMGTFSPSVEPLIARTYDLLGRRWAMGGTGSASLNTCCSGIVTHGNVFTVESSLLVVARLWSVCAEAGLENITTACVTSFAIHTEILELIHKEPGLADKVDRALYDACGRRLVVPQNIVHCSDVFYRYRGQLAQLMKYRLIDMATGAPLKVVDHVGCHYNKIFPSKSVGGTEYCDVLTAMIREWGGDEVDYPERRHCCGMGFRQCMIRPNRSFTVACARKKFESMAPFAPDLIITNCPGCGLVLDREQWAVNELTGAKLPDPGPQLCPAGRPALGWDPYEVVGIQGHTVPVEPLLERIGIPRPERPAYLLDDSQAAVKSQPTGSWECGEMNSPVLVLGGGVTGMHVATALAELGYRSILLEKSAKLGGRVRRLSRTFPFFDDDGFNDGLEFTSQVEREMRAHACVDVRMETTLVSLEGEFPDFQATLSDRTSEAVSAVVIADRVRTVRSLGPRGVRLQPLPECRDGA